MNTNRECGKPARKQKDSMSRLGKPTGILLVLFIFFLTVTPTSQAQGKFGKISGQVISKENGQALLGATVAIASTVLGAITDLDGNFRINKVPVGTYTLKATSVGFAPIVLTEVVVADGEMTPVNFIMEPQVIETEGVKVEATVNKNTQAILLYQRRNASAVTDGISAQEISRAGSSDAAEAITKVTGASVVDGKFVFVRGLGDRYANTQLNGSSLPTPDPDKQAVPMDLIPTGLLDNITVEKTFTPDKPGDFAGGSVNLNTKEYPEIPSLVFSTSTGSNSQSEYGSQILLHDPGSKDWLGFDDGKRSIPRIILDNQDIQEELPTSTTVTILEENLDDSLYIVNFMDSSAKAFNPQMTGRKRDVPLNQSHSISYGNQHALFGNPLGVLASLSYSKKYSYFNNGQANSYTNKANQFTGLLGTNSEFRDEKGVEEVLWGGLLNFKYGFHPNHKIGWSLMHTRSGESESRFLHGISPDYTERPQDPLRNYVLWYKERKLTTNQFSGSHVMFDNKIRTDWQISLSNTKGEDPDVRFFTDELQIDMLVDEATGDTTFDTNYVITPSTVPRPQRLWREIEEENDQYQFNFTIPLSSKSKFKHGFEFLNNHRDVSERRFQYVNTSNYPSFEGDVNAYISDVGVGAVLIDTVKSGPNAGKTRYRYRFTNFTQERSKPENNYFGNKDIFAVFGMFEVPLIWNLYFVGGARYEYTDMATMRSENGSMLGNISEEDLLPSANLILRLGGRMNFRLVYGKSLARPTLLEMSESHIEGFNTGDFFNGNPDLKMTRIHNYDLRWEWFVNPGEIIAVSGFIKKFQDPIEPTITSFINQIQVQPRNVGDADLFGIELEYRRSMGFISNTLRNFRLGGNFTFVESEVKLDEDELAGARNVDPEFPSTRPKSGQSPYLVNVDLEFERYQSGTSLSLFYNVFGRRLAYNSEGATPDVYEKSRHQLDFISSQRLLGGTTFKLSVKNILNQNYELEYDNAEEKYVQDYLYRWYPIGVGYNIGVSYHIW